MYFDVLGSFIVSGKEISATLVNVIIILGSAYSVWYNMNYTPSKDKSFIFGKMYIFLLFIKIALHFVIGISRSTYAKGLKWGVGFILLSWILTLVFVLGLAFVITLLNRPLSWFARPIWIFFLYIIPTFLTSIFVAQAFKRKFNTVSFTRTVFHCVKKEIYYSCCVSDDLITVDNIDDLLRQQYLHIHNDFFVPDALVHTI